MTTHHHNKGISYRRGTKEERENRKKGRQCTFIYANLADRETGSTRRCRRSTGINRFFCKEHLEEVRDYGMEGI